MGCLGEDVGQRSGGGLELLHEEVEPVVKGLPCLSTCSPPGKNGVAGVRPADLSPGPRN